MNTAYYSANRYLTQEEQRANARYIWVVLKSWGWSLNAVAGMLGNMQTESTINPGIWQNLDEGNTSLGYGLVQWTPATKYLEWCEAQNLAPEALMSALTRIEYELENGLQWIATDAYPLSFEEFKTSKRPAYELAEAFLLNYERPADQDQPQRGRQATTWYTYLADIGAGSSTPSSGKSKLPLWFWTSAARRRRV